MYGVGLKECKNMRIKNTAIFDLDGTLVDTDAANTAAYKVALRRYGVGNVISDNARITTGDVRRMLGSGIEDVVKSKVDAYRAELWRTRLLSVAVALKKCFEKRMVEKVVLLTDSNERRAMETLRFHGLDRCFDEIVCNGGNGDKYANYFKVYDSDPAACVVWENENRQINAAIAAGVKNDNIRKVA